MNLESQIQKISSFQHLELLANQIVEGFISGMHKSPFHGFSVEFAEHRLYNPGESTRNIDWRLYGRSEKLFTKKYEEDKDNILDYYNSLGYRDATIVNDTVYYNGNGHINIDIKVSEGRRYYFGNITWRGNTKYPDSVLSSILNIKKGDIYNRETFFNKLGKTQTAEGGDISGIYQDDGYLFFSVNPIETAVYNDTIDFEVRIQEGPQATIKTIRIAGNEKTKDFVVRREIRTVPGDKFSRTLLIRSQREISQLNYFALATSSNTSTRINFASSKNQFAYPDFLDIQLKSFQEFFQLETTPENRESEGLFKVFAENFPITDTRNQFVLEFLDYFIDPPRYTIDECIERGLTYSVPLKAKLKLYCTDPEHEDFETIVQDVYLGTIPYMTPKGSFVINGAERVVVSQLHRSPGICFEESAHTSGKMLHAFRIIPDRGTWIEVQFDQNDLLWVYLDRRRRRRKFLVTTLLRAFGYKDDKDILALFYQHRELTAKAALELDPSLRPPPPPSSDQRRGEPS